MIYSPALNVSPPDHARLFEAFRTFFEGTPTEDDSRIVRETSDGTLLRSLEAHPDADPRALENRPRAGARAAVLVKTAPGRTPLSESDIQKLVAGSVPGLEPHAVAVVLLAAPASAEPASGALAAVGPFRVTPASRAPLITVFALALTSIGVLGALLFVNLSGDGLFAVDVTDPAHPFGRGFLRTLGWGTHVAFAGNSAYVASGYFGVYRMALSPTP